MPLYDAFISYSHAKDKPIAAALQSVVQRLGKPWYQRRALRIFRDDTSLSATPHLWPTIEQALGESRFLILLASPEAAQSHWVGKEVAYWLEHKGPDTLLIALTDGVLAWEEAQGDFGWSAATPLPPPLKGKFAAEPKWVDLCAYRAGASPRDATFNELGADFAAAIRGIPKEDLLSQEVRQQRNALRLAWSAVGTLLVLVAMVGWQWQRANTQRDRAENALGAARQTAETLVFDLARDLRTRPGMPADLVDDILARVQALQRQLGTTGSTVELYRLEAASLYMLSQSSEAKGDIAAALQAVRRSLAILELLATQHPDQRLVQRDLAVSLNQLADLRRKEKEWPEVLALHRRALAITERLAAEDPGNVNLQRDVWLTDNKIAEVEVITGAYDAALVSYRKGLERARTLLETEPGNPQLQSDLAFSYGRIAITLNALQRYPEALEAHRQSLALREQAAAQSNDTSRQREVSVSLHRIGEILIKLDRRAEAIESFRKAIAIMEQLAASDPRNVAWQNDLIGIYDPLGQLLVQSGQLAPALDAFRRGVASRERRVAIMPDNLAWQADLATSLLFVGNTLLAAGKADDAIDSYRKAAQAFAKLVATEPDNIARAKQLSGIYLTLGDLFANRKQWQDARDAYAECRTAQAALLARNPADQALRRDLAMAIDRSGLASGNLEDLPAALASYRDALVLRDQVMAAEPGNVQFRREYVLTLSMAADALYRLGRKAESQSDFRKAFAIVEAYAAAAPENALLQLDLAIGLYRLAYYLDDDPTPRRDRAREVVRRLEGQGQLTAAQRDFIAQLEQLLVDKPHG